MRTKDYWVYTWKRYLSQNSATTRTALHPITAWLYWLYNALTSFSLILKHLCSEMPPADGLEGITSNETAESNRVKRTLPKKLDVISFQFEYGFMRIWGKRKKIEISSAQNVVSTAQNQKCGTTFASKKFNLHSKMGRIVVFRGNVDTK